MLTHIQHDDGAILELNMARPPVNALNPELVKTLLEAIEAAPGQGAKAIVLSGQPGMFSAGLDVPALLPLDKDQMLAFWKDFSGLMGAIARSPIPVASALTGHSPAGGAVLALFGDVRIMAEGDFKIGLNEVRVGLTLPPVILKAFQRQLGNRVAEQYAVAGFMASPDQALEAGLVDQLVPADKVVETAITWCRERLALPPQAMAATRAFARRDLVQLFDELDDAADQAFLDVWFSDETRGTMQALVESLKNKKK
ncbi:MAG: enoyl-CoA hydratase/isomerase family protein [Gammaproteobacteria bacterium]|nr:enoyl-CoA hydratase/isomerase family protein [Gammaproteobacteria bacterium]